MAEVNNQLQTDQLPVDLNLTSKLLKGLTLEDFHGSQPKPPLPLHLTLGDSGSFEKCPILRFERIVLPPGGRLQQKDRSNAVYMILFEEYLVIAEKIYDHEPTPDELAKVTPILTQYSLDVQDLYDPAHTFLCLFVTRLHNVTIDLPLLAPSQHHDYECDGDALDSFVINFICQGPCTIDQLDFYVNERYKQPPQSKKEKIVFDTTMQQYHQPTITSISFDLASSYTSWITILTSVIYYARQFQLQYYPLITTSPQDDPDYSYNNNHVLLWGSQRSQPVLTPNSSTRTLAGAAASPTLSPALSQQSALETSSPITPLINNIDLLPMVTNPILDCMRSGDLAKLYGILVTHNTFLMSKCPPDRQGQLLEQLKQDPEYEQMRKRRSGIGITLPSPSSSGSSSRSGGGDGANTGNTPISIDESHVWSPFLVEYLNTPIVTGLTFFSYSVIRNDPSLIQLFLDCDCSPNQPLLDIIYTKKTLSVQRFLLLSTIQYYNEHTLFVKNDHVLEKTTPVQQTLINLDPQKLSTSTIDPKTFILYRGVDISKLSPIQREYAHIYHPFYITPLHYCCKYLKADLTGLLLSKLTPHQLDTFLAHQNILFQRNEMYSDNTEFIPEYFIHDALYTFKSIYSTNLQYEMHAALLNRPFSFKNDLRFVRLNPCQVYMPIQRAFEELFSILSKLYAIAGSFHIFSKLSKSGHSVLEIMSSFEPIPNLTEMYDLILSENDSKVMYATPYQDRLMPFRLRRFPLDQLPHLQHDEDNINVTMDDDGELITDEEYIRRCVTHTQHDPLQTSIPHEDLCDVSVTSGENASTGDHKDGDDHDNDGFELIDDDDHLDFGDHNDPQQSSDIPHIPSIASGPAVFTFPKPLDTFNPVQYNHGITDITRKYQEFVASICKLLCSNHANPTKISLYGTNAMTQAIRMGNLELIDLYLSHRYGPNQPVYRLYPRPRQVEPSKDSFLPRKGALTRQQGNSVLYTPIYAFDMIILQPNPDEVLLPAHKHPYKTPLFLEAQFQHQQGCFYIHPQLNLFNRVIHAISHQSMTALDQNDSNNLMLHQIFNPDRLQAKMIAAFASNGSLVKYCLPHTNDQFQHNPLFRSAYEHGQRQWASKQAVVHHLFNPLGKGEWMANDKSKVCLKCPTKFVFSLFGGGQNRHHCRCCGELVCSDCSTKVIVTHDQQKHRVCDTCYNFYDAKVKRANESMRQCLPSSITATSTKPPLTSESIHRPSAKEKDSTPPQHHKKASSADTTTSKTTPNTDNTQDLLNENTEVLMKNRETLRNIGDKSEAMQASSKNFLEQARELARRQK